MHVTPFLSIVIPTHNRLKQLRQCISALLAQNYPRAQFEIVIVADGCTDGTFEEFNNTREETQVNIVSQPSSGAATARNRGVREARGEVVVFIDDDVIAGPGLLAAHARHHGCHRRRAVVGPYVPSAPPGNNLWRLSLYRYWQARFDAMSKVPDGLVYTDCLSGNLSIRKDTFNEVGGFNESFPVCGIEDYELGARLIDAGIELLYEPGASALHLDTTDLTRSFQRKYQEGKSTILLVKLHPLLFPSTPLAKTSVISRASLRLKKWAPIVAPIAQAILPLLEKLRLDPLWFRILTIVHEVEFWRAVGDESASTKVYRSLERSHRSDERGT